MGLMVHSLSELPLKAERDYYVYLLRGGWDDEITKTLSSTFSVMADHASRTRSAVISGTDCRHFNNEVFSWHHLNGVEMEDHLPCVIITTLHPSRFRDEQAENWQNLRDEQLLVIPLRKYCKTPNEVSSLLEGLFRDIRDGKRLQDFNIVDRMRPGLGKAAMDAIILRPSIAGLGIDLKVLGSALFDNKPCPKRKTSE